MPIARAQRPRWHNRLRKVKNHKGLAGCWPAASCVPAAPHGLLTWLTCMSGLPAVIAAACPAQLKNKACRPEAAGSPRLLTASRLMKLGSGIMRSPWAGRRASDGGAAELAACIHARTRAAKRSAVSAMCCKRARRPQAVMLKPWCRHKRLAANLRPPPAPNNALPAATQQAQSNNAPGSTPASATHTRAQHCGLPLVQHGTPTRPAAAHRPALTLAQSPCAALAAHKHTQSRGGQPLHAMHRSTSQCCRGPRSGIAARQCVGVAG